MTNRLSASTETFVSSSWVPASDLFLQFDGAVGSAQVAVEARVEAGASWRTVAFLDSATPILWLVQLPEVRLRLIDNRALVAVNVWSSN